MFSDNLAHKCCKSVGIRSKTNRGRKISGRENVKFPNTVKGNWNVTKPLEIVVSDITCFKHKGIRWEWTYLLDVYNNEIIASSVTNKIGNSLPYYHCLEQLIEMKKEQNCPVSPHTDQGSVYNYGVHNCIGFYSVPALELKRRLFDDSDIIEPYAIELADREDELYALIQKRNRQGIVGSFLLRRSRETKCLKAYPLLKRNLTYIRAPRTFKAADLPKNSKNGRV